MTRWLAGAIILGLLVSPIPAAAQGGGASGYGRNARTSARRARWRAPWRRRNREQHVTVGRADQHHV